MKKFIAMLTLLIGFNANAGLLNVDFSSNDVKVGETISVTISAQDFDATDYFEFYLNFDTAMLGYDEVSLDSDLLEADESNDGLSGLEITPQFSELWVDYNNDDFSLDGSFMLASFDLTALVEGVTSFELSNFFNQEEYSLDYGISDYEINYNGLNVSSSSINVSAVPEPSTLFMMMLAGFALVNTRRKTKQTINLVKY